MEPVVSALHPTPSIHNTHKMYNRRRFGGCAARVPDGQTMTTIYIVSLSERNAMNEENLTLSDGHRGCNPSLQSSACTSRPPTHGGARPCHDARSASWMPPVINPVAPRPRTRDGRGDSYAGKSLRRRWASLPAPQASNGKHDDDSFLWYLTRDDEQTIEKLQLSLSDYPCAAVAVAVI